MESILIGYVITFNWKQGYGDIILQAIILTGAIFQSLTLFTFKSKIDFSFLGPGLDIGLTALFIWGISSLIVGIQIGNLYALVGSIIFCGYILYDTHKIIHTLSHDDYVSAAIHLYLDVLNLFLDLLKLLKYLDSLKANKNEKKKTS